MFKFPVKLRAALLLAVLLSGPAAAQPQRSQLGCLEAAQGKTLVWSERLAEDRRDEGVHYDVVSVSVKNKIPERSVTLELRTRYERAVQKARTVKATSEETARRYCDQLRTVQPYEDPFKPPEPPRAYIHYTKDGWVRGDPPMNSRIVECQVGTEKYGCLEDEKNRYANSLNTLPELIKWLEPKTEQ